MTAVSDDEQLRADGGVEQDLGRVPRDDSRGDLHAVGAQGPVHCGVDGLLCPGAPVDMGGHRVHAGQGRVLPGDHGLDVRAGERGLANGPCKGVKRARGAVDSNNDVSGGLHNVMPAFCRDLTGTWTTSRVNAQWCGPLWRLPETGPEGARQLLSSRWNKAATVTSRDGRRCRRSVWLRWRLGRQAVSARSLTCLVSWRPWRGARPRASPAASAMWNVRAGRGCGQVAAQGAAVARVVEDLGGDGVHAGKEREDTGGDLP